MSDPFFEYLRCNHAARAKQAGGARAGAHKDYPRFKRIDLPEPEPIETPLSEALLSRTSARDWGKGDLSVKDLATLLHWGMGERAEGRMQPSGGGLYPIEAYVCSKSVANLPDGLYHFNSNQRVLEQLPGTWHVGVQDALASAELSLEGARAVIYLSYVKTRNNERYGEFGYKLAFVEAGHIGQNLYLAAAALGIACRAKGVVDPRQVTRLLHLEGTDENVIYAIGFGARVDK